MSSPSSSTMAGGESKGGVSSTQVPPREGGLSLTPQTQTQQPPRAGSCRQSCAGRGAGLIHPWQLLGEI